MSYKYFYHYSCHHLIPLLVNKIIYKERVGQKYIDFVSTPYPSHTSLSTSSIFYIIHDIYTKELEMQSNTFGLSTKCSIDLSSTFYKKSAK